MSGRYMLALDQGMSSSRAALSDVTGLVVASARVPPWCVLVGARRILRT